MDRRALSARRIVASVVAAGASVACSGGDDDTLAPLPIEGATTASAGPAATTITDSGTATGSTTPGGLPLPSAAPGAASPTTTTSAVAAPTADWDGARFDVGIIDSVSTLGAYTAIDLDRWSYAGPDGNPLDADELDAEPLAAWWTVSPYSNENVRTRTFVLATGVEVLTLDPADRSRACAQPPPANPPTRWNPSNLSAVGPTPEGTFAVLTYSPTGQITRLRLTRSC